MSDVLNGRCGCGAISWTAKGPPLWAGFCHCDSCRRATSAAVTAFFGVPRASVAWSSEPARITSSGGKVARLFCPTCGTQLSYQSEAWPAEAHLYAVSLDDPKLFSPDGHYHFAEKVPWLKIDDDLPKYAGSSEDGPPLKDL